MKYSDEWIVPKRTLSVDLEGLTPVFWKCQLWVVCHLTSFLLALSKPFEIHECALFFSFSDLLHRCLCFKEPYPSEKQTSHQPRIWGRGGEGIMTMFTGWIKILLSTSPACQWMQMSFILLSVWVCAGGGGDRGGSQCSLCCYNAELRQPPAHHLLPNPFRFSEMTDISQSPVAHLAKILMHPKVQMAATIQNRESEIKSKQAEQNPMTNTWFWTCC